MDNSSSNSSQALTIISSESLIIKQVSSQQQFKYSKNKKPLLKNTLKKPHQYSCLTHKLTIYGDQISESEESEDEYERDLRKNRKQVYSRASSFLRIYSLLIALFSGFGKSLKHIFSILCYPCNFWQYSKKKQQKYYRSTPPLNNFKSTATSGDQVYKQTLSTASSMSSSQYYQQQMSKHQEKKQKRFNSQQLQNSTNTIYSDSSSAISDNFYAENSYLGENVQQSKMALKTTQNQQQSQQTDCVIQNILPLMKVYDTHLHNLVLDLDETLVFCSEKAQNDDAFLLSISMPDETKQFYLHKRNYLEEFLNECAEYFNIYIFTAAAREYAEEVVKFIDPCGLIKKIYSRSNCFFDGKQWNKSLTSIDLDLNKTVMIDNSSAIVANNSANALKISDYRAETHEDYELVRFSQFLKRMLENQPDDFRNYLDQISKNI